jgi:hypothetical protein
VFYQHGQPGSAEEEVRRAAADRGLAKAGFAVIGFTDVVNRVIIPDGNLATLNTDTYVTFVTYNKMPDYLELLTNAEQLAFLRVIPRFEALDVFPLGAPDGTPDVDPKKPLAYFGLSQGATHGIGMLAFAPEIHSAALTVGAGRLGPTLVHQSSEDLYRGIAGVAPALTRTQLYEGLALLQMVYDSQDSQNLAPYLYREPFDLGVSGRASVLLTEGLGDSVVPQFVMRSGASQLGIPQLEPFAERVPSLTSVTAPLSGNIASGTTAAFFQFVPKGSAAGTPTPGCNNQTEGHFCAQSAAEAERQRLEFFTSALSGTPRIIDPAVSSP